MKWGKNITRKWKTVLELTFMYSFSCLKQTPPDLEPATLCRSENLNINKFVWAHFD